MANAAGGVDWIAVTTARMRGWKTRSFREKRFHHYRSLGTAEKNNIAALFSYGEKDFYLGNSPIWEAFRVVYRGTKRPFAIGGFALLDGYCWAALSGTKRAVSRELMRFHRKEEMAKLRAILSTVLSFKKVDHFQLAPHERPSLKPRRDTKQRQSSRKRIAELEATVERQQKGMEMLTAQLKEQRSLIQKVSAQLELSKSATSG